MDGWMDGWIDNVNGTKYELFVNLTKGYVRILCTTLATFCKFEIISIYFMRNSSPKKWSDFESHSWKVANGVWNWDDMPLGFPASLLAQMNDRAKIWSLVPCLPHFHHPVTPRPVWNILSFPLWESNHETKINYFYCKPTCFMGITLT